MDDDLVKLRLKFHEGEDLPAGEGLWARPVDAHDGGGTYALENSSFFVPLAVGDVVRAALDGDSCLQVVDLVAPSEHILTVTQVLAADIAAVCDRWLAVGALWSEGSGGFMSTIWRPGLSVDDIGTVLDPEARAGTLRWLATAEPSDRTRSAMADEVDFVLDTHQHFPPTGTSYWAADDPYWREAGLADPEFLAQVQSLASDDDRVARALERGQQDRVVLYLERLCADPRDLPPLDGPIFDDD